MTDRQIAFGIIIACALFALLAVLAPLAKGAPPENADPALAPWFRSLQGNDGVSCCSIADCRATDDRVKDGHYEALIAGAWIPVPDDKVLRRTDNPTGRAVVCWLPNRGVMCFIAGSET
jgi:hypothetical protein